MNHYHYAVWGVGVTAAWLEGAKTTERASAAAKHYGFDFSQPESWAVEYILDCEGNEYQAAGVIDARTRQLRSVHGWTSLPRGGKMREWQTRTDYEGAGVKEEK